MIRVQELKRIRKIDGEPIEVKVENTANIRDIAIIQAMLSDRNYEIDSTYYVSNIDRYGNYLCYLATFDKDRVLRCSQEDEKLCTLANQPLTEIQKLGIILTVIEKYGFTDYVADMVEAKRLNMDKLDINILVTYLVKSKVSDDNKIKILRAKGMSEAEAEATLLSAVKSNSINNSCGVCR